MTLSRALTVSSLTVIVIISAWLHTAMPRPPTVDAGHDNPASSHLTDLIDFDLAGGRIVQNVIKGDAIPVCSDDLPLSTAAAAERWNTFFGTTAEVFKLKDRANLTVYPAGDPGCRASRGDASLGIGSVLIVKDPGRCINFACINRTATKPNDDWDTYVGQPVIYVGEFVPNHMGVLEEGPVVDGSDRVTRAITHELGHVFGLGNYAGLLCRSDTPSGADPNDYPISRSVMSAVPIRGTTAGVDTCYSAFPASQDEVDFQNSYIPEPPKIDEDASGSDGANEATIVADVYRVHVETEFAAEHQNANGGWDRVGSPQTALPLPPIAPPLSALLGTSPIQPVRITITGQTPGLNTYRVVSLTRAPLQPTTPPASGPVTIGVLAPPPPFVVCPAPGPNTIPCVLSPPTNLSVSDVGHTGATLHWGDVAGAAGYKVRRDGIANRTQTLGDVNSHPFTRLTARTAHVLEVATTISSGDSRFASLTLLLPPTNLAWTATTSTITLTWAGDTNARYEVKLGAGGTADDADSDTSHPFRLLASDADYDLYVRAVNSQGPSAWASIAARTSARPPRPPATFSTVEVAVSSSTVWEQEGDGFVICWVQQYRYDRYVIQTWITTYTWNGSIWVSQSSLLSSSAEKERKTAIGGPVPIHCFPRSSSDAAAGASADQSQFLTAGEYVFTWGDARVGFSVPAEARVDLTWRVLESGVRAAVLTDEGAGEVLVHPGAAAARDARDSDPDKRSTALQSIEGSIGPADPAAEQPAQPLPTPCAVVSADSPPASIDLDTNRCASVAAGGQVRITVAGHVLSLTLTSDRYWVVARLRTDATDGSEPVALFDATTTSSLVLDPATGAELERNISDDAPTEIGALFDAIAASVQHSAATDDGS